MDDDHMIAQWLDAMIVKHDTKIQDLAKHVGVSVSQISKWKSGEQLLKKPDHVFKIADFYEVDPFRLLATADETFRGRGYEPLPVPDVGHEHLLARLPRYVGARERALMGRIATLRASGTGHTDDDPMDKVEQTFDAIDEMLDTVQLLIEGETEDESEQAGQGQGPGGGGEGGKTWPSGRGAGRTGANPGRKRGRWGGRSEAANRLALSGYLAPGW